jgi:hypothetical protein
VTHDVIFEKKVGDGWQPTRSSDCKPGDTIRMRQADGTLLGDEGVVSAKDATDPDSHRRFDLGLDFLGG